MPLLSDAARHLVYPSTIQRSVFPKVQARLADVGVTLDDWQQGFGTIALGLDESDEYASTIGGVVASIPRQVGKTFTVGNLIIGLCLEFPGFQAIWTSHHGGTTKNTLQSMEGMVRKPRLWPEIANVYTNNNDMRIVFRNGSTIKFGAREHGFGRGLDAIDALIFDEAQKLGIRALEDMVPAANQSKNDHSGLVFFLGTPPRPVDDGEAFAAKRSQALKGNEDDDMVYVEFSAAPGSDPDDRKQWPVMNPSYPARTSTKAMLRMKKNMPDPDSWRREAMGIWDDDGGAVISADRWAELAGAGPVNGVKPSALGVDMSHDRMISVAACWQLGANAHIEEVHANPDAAEAVDLIVARAGRRMPVFIDSLGPAAALIPELQARRVNVKASSAADMAKGCGQFEDRATAGTLSHSNQDSINNALASARKRPIRDAGGWGWDRSSPTTPIYPLVAATLALVAASGAPRRMKAASKGMVVLS